MSGNTRDGDIQTLKVCVPQARGIRGFFGNSFIVQDRSDFFGYHGSWLRPFPVRLPSTISQSDIPGRFPFPIFQSDFPV